MSFAGFSFETATRRMGDWEGDEAELMRERIEVKLSPRVLARDGSTFMSSLAFGLPSDAVSVMVVWSANTAPSEIRETVMAMLQVPDVVGEFRQCESTTDSK